MVAESSSEGISEGAGTVVDFCCGFGGSFVLEAVGSNEGTFKPPSALSLEAFRKVRGSPSAILRNLEGVGAFLFFFRAYSEAATLSDIFLSLGGAKGPLLSVKFKIIPPEIGE